MKNHGTQVVGEAVGLVVAVGFGSGVVLGAVVAVLAGGRLVCVTLAAGSRRGVVMTAEALAMAAAVGVSRCAGPVALGVASAGAGVVTGARVTAPIGVTTAGVGVCPVSSDTSNVLQPAATSAANNHSRPGPRLRFILIVLSAASTYGDGQRSQK